MRARTRHNLGLYLSHAVLILASLSILLPILWVLRTSLANRLIAYKIPPVWIFTPTLDNYRVIFEQYPFQQYFLNSLVVSAVASLIALVIGSLAGYSIARFRTGDPVLRLSMLSTQMLPAIALVIPIFLLARLFHLWDSRTGLIIAYLSFNLPYTIWILIGFFQTIPLDLEEAAMIDGASSPQQLRYLTVPLMMPTILVATLIRLIAALKTYDLIYILTRGGPGISTETISYYIYRVAFVFLDMGTSAAMSFLLLALIVVLTLVLMRVMRTSEI